MPKRVVHGEGIWRSDKLAHVEPPHYRAEYTNILPLAGENGVFECQARRVWAEVFSYNRPDRSVEDVERILAEFERVKLLFRWEEGGKVYGYIVGSDKAGRRPRPSHVERARKAGRLCPDPPEAELREFQGLPALGPVPVSGAAELRKVRSG